MATKKGDKTLAYELFMDGLTQARIAQLLGVSTSTVQRWATAGGWAERRVDRGMVEVDVQEVTMELLQYQLNALKMKKDAWLEDGDGHLLLERGDIDALQKLYTTIRRDLIKWQDYVTVTKELLSWLMDQDLALAKALRPYVQDFVDEKQHTLR